MDKDKTYTAFAGVRRIASGDLNTMLLQVKSAIDGGENETILIFEDQTGKQIDFDFRGTPEEVIARLPAHPLFAANAETGPARSGPGRPKLGVVCREVSLLPRHWEWLDEQPGGISVTLRKLVEEARKQGQNGNLARQRREAAGKFLWALAGNLPGFEEASRALFAGETERLQGLIAEWPVDIRQHLAKLLAE